MSQALAQAYIPMVKEGNYWKCLSLHPWLQTWDTTAYYLRGDTTVNAVSYKKMYQCGGVVAVLREDSIARKVYGYQYVNNNQGTIGQWVGCGSFATSPEITFYDFSVEKGDTILACGYSQIVKLYIDTTYYAYLEGKTRKVVHYQAFDDFYTLTSPQQYVEGLGDYVVSGTYISGGPFPCSETQLLAFQENYTGICTYSAIDMPKEQQSIHLYPNPAQKELTIECLNPTVSPTEICIYNAIGISKDCFSFESELKIVIPLDNYSEGIYYYSCFYPNERSQIGKFIIIR